MLNSKDMHKIVIGNWKQNPENLDKAEELLKVTEENSRELLERNIFVTHAVPSIFVGYLIGKNKEIILQNISSFEGGSHTGEISAVQAKSLGLSMSIVGHSETRLGPTNPRGDEDREVNLKVKNLLENNLLAVLCVGEAKREGLDFKKYIQDQIKNCLLGVEESSLENVVIAYEPIWAIGKDAVRPATNEEIVEVIKSIKDFLKEKYPLAGGKVPVLYGGSVDESNAAEILVLDGVDGLLVGRASCDKEKWEKLLKSIVFATS